MKIIRRYLDDARGVAHLVRHKKKNYRVSTSYAVKPLHEQETKIFRANKHGKVRRWSDDEIWGGYGDSMEEALEHIKGL